MRQDSLMQRSGFPISLVLLKTALTMEPNHVGYTLPYASTVSFQTFLVSAFRWRVQDETRSDQVTRNAQDSRNNDWGFSKGTISLQARRQILKSKPVV